MGESTRSITNDTNMPSKRCITKWLADPSMSEFREMYYHARRVQAEMLIDEIFEIADNTDGDYITRHDKNGEPYQEPNNEHIQRSRVRIDARKWYAARMIPKIYGDKQQIEHEVTGDLAELLKNASNNDKGLPPPIEGETT